MPNFEGDPFMAQPGVAGVVNCGFSLRDMGHTSEDVRTAIELHPTILELPEYQRNITALVTSNRSDEYFRLLQDIRSLKSVLPFELSLEG